MGCGVFIIFDVSEYSEYMIGERTKVRYISQIHQINNNHMTSIQRTCVFGMLALIVSIKSLAVLAPGQSGEAMPDKQKYFKIEQGFSYGRILDQRMSNLHYTGPGGMLAFGRHARQDHQITEWNFARFVYHNAGPGHEGTLVNNLALGVRYMHLWALGSRGAFDFFLGGQANVFGDVRIAPSLGNSFLFSDLVGSVHPHACAEYAPYFFNRPWRFDFSLSIGLLGYGIRLPEYGSTFQLSGDGGSRMLNNERMILRPGNHAHFITGVFIRESFGGAHNPNFFRVGYVWDYYRIRGSHGLNVYNASHQFVLELFFMVN